MKNPKKYWTHTTNSLFSVLQRIFSNLTLFYVSFVFFFPCHFVRCSVLGLKVIQIFEKRNLLNGRTRAVWTVLLTWQKNDQTGTYSLSQRNKGRSQNKRIGGREKQEKIITAKEDGQSDHRYIEVPRAKE